MIAGSETVRPDVEIYKGFMRKYWNRTRETLTFKLISTSEWSEPNCLAMILCGSDDRAKKRAKQILALLTADRSNYRNEIRAFLYQTPDDLLDAIDEISYLTLPYSIEGDMEFGTFQISTEMRGYEKELFYLKCISLELKPMQVLSALYLLSTRRTREEVFTTPEFLFALVYIREVEKIPLRKDYKFTSI